MKIYRYILALGLTLSKFCIASQSVSTAYEITIQDNLGVERQTLVVPLGGETRQLKMAAGTVEIQPSLSDKSTVRIGLYLQKDGKQFLAHSATISDQQEIKIAYSLCDGIVTFYSPRPKILPMCNPSSHQ